MNKYGNRRLNYDRLNKVYELFRRELKLKENLAYYGIKDIRYVGDEVKIPCPLHTDEQPSFNINTKKYAFNCLSCGAKGNYVHLLMLLEDRVNNKKVRFSQILEDWLSVNPKARMTLGFFTVFGDTVQSNQRIGRVIFKKENLEVYTLLDLEKYIRNLSKDNWEASIKLVTSALYAGISPTELMKIYKGVDGEAVNDIINEVIDDVETSDLEWDLV